jgi:prophage regulatory protein
LGVFLRLQKRYTGLTTNGFTRWISCYWGSYRMPGYQWREAPPNAPLNTPKNPPSFGAMDCRAEREIWKSSNSNPAQANCPPRPMPRTKIAITETVSPVYVGLDALELLTTLSTSTIQGMIARDEFPKPRELSKRRVAWLYREILEWAEMRPVSHIPPPPNTAGGGRQSTIASRHPQDSSKAP